MKVLFMPQVLAQIKYFVDKSHVEISGLGRVKKTEDGNMLVTKVYLLEQENTGSSTDIDQTAASKLMFETHSDATEYGDLTFWWHSHVNMSVFWSGTDTATLKQFGDNGYLLATVFNKRGEMRSAYYQGGKGFHPAFFIDEIKTEVLVPQIPAVNVTRFENLSVDEMNAMTPEENLVYLDWLKETTLKRIEDTRTNIYKKITDVWQAEYDLKCKTKSWGGAHSTGSGSTSQKGKETTKDPYDNYRNYDYYYDFYSKRQTDYLRSEWERQYDHKTGTWTYEPKDHYCTVSRKWTKVIPTSGPFATNKEGEKGNEAASGTPATDTSGTGTRDEGQGSGATGTQLSLVTDVKQIAEKARDDHKTKFSTHSTSGKMLTAGMDCTGLTPEELRDLRDLEQMIMAIDAENEAREMRTNPSLEEPPKTTAEMFSGWYGKNTGHDAISLQQELVIMAAEKKPYSQLSMYDVGCLIDAACVVYEDLDQYMDDGDLLRGAKVFYKDLLDNVNEAVADFQIGLQTMFDKDISEALQNSGA